MNGCVLAHYQYSCACSGRIRMGVATHNPQSANIISVKFCKRPTCKNFVPRKFGAMIAFFEKHVLLLSIPTCPIPPLSFPPNAIQDETLPVLVCPCYRTAGLSPRIYAQHTYTDSSKDPQPTVEGEVWTADVRWWQHHAAHGGLGQGLSSVRWLYWRVRDQPCAMYLV